MIRAWDSSTEEIQEAANDREPILIGDGWPTLRVRIYLFEDGHDATPTAEIWLAKDGYVTVESDAR